VEQYTVRGSFPGVVRRKNNEEIPVEIWDRVLLSPAVEAAGRSGWEGWPFNSPSGEFSFTTSAARILFVLVVFLLLAWILRKLFGPGGRLRPEEFGTEHINERKRNRRQQKELRARWKAGEISQDEYAAELSRLMSE